MPDGTVLNGSFVPYTISSVIFKSIGTEKTRAANATAYGAKDVIASGAGADLWEFDLARFPGGSGRIVRVVLRSNDKTSVFRARIHLFNIAPAAIADNAVMACLYASNGSKQGSIDLPALGTEDTTASDAAEAVLATVSFPIKCAMADTKLYALVETLDAISTPVSGSKFYLELTAELY